MRPNIFTRIPDERFSLRASIIHDDKPETQPDHISRVLKTLQNSDRPERCIHLVPKQFCQQSTQITNKQFHFQEFPGSESLNSRVRLSLKK